MALPRKAPTPTSEGVNLLDYGLYIAGGGLPPGEYVWEDVSLVMHTGFDKTKPKPPRLVVMIKMRNRHDPQAQVREQVYGIGTGAEKSFSTDSTGKRLIPIPGAPPFPLRQVTNWGVLLKSLIDCDPTVSTLPQNDLSVLDGLWAHMDNVPEPDERKTYVASGSNITEAGAEPRKDQTIAVVTGILEGGKPWEGGGGVKGVTITPKKTNGAPVPQVEATDDTVRIAAITGLEMFLSDNPNGGSRLLTRANTLKHVEGKYGAAIAKQVETQIFGDDAALNAALGEHGYMLSANQIKLIP